MSIYKKKEDRFLWILTAIHRGLFAVWLIWMVLLFVFIATLIPLYVSELSHQANLNTLLLLIMGVLYTGSKILPFCFGLIIDLIQKDLKELNK